MRTYAKSKIRFGIQSTTIGWPGWAAVFFLLMIIVPGVIASAEEVLCTNGEEPDAQQSLIEPLAAVKVPAPIKRGFYLTNTNYACDQVLTACARGYHTASMWELLDISTLNYHYKHPYAEVKDDSGRGAPSYWYGWVRTGYYSSNSSTAGTGNCINWTSVSGADYGVSVRLTNNWQTALGAIGPWEATAFPCYYTGPVWCISDKR